MNLDDIQAIYNLDPSRVIESLNRMPERLESAWKFGLNIPVIPAMPVEGVAILGDDETCIAAEICRACFFEHENMAFFISQHGILPTFIRGEGWIILHIGREFESSTQEQTWKKAQARGCRTLRVRLTQSASSKISFREFSTPDDFLLQVDPPNQILAVLGGLAGIFSKWGVISNLSPLIEAAVKELVAHRENYRVESPVFRNPAKRGAGQLMGRWAAIYAGESFAPVAHYWKLQLNRIAKNWAQWECITSDECQSAAGLMNPSGVLSNMLALFLKGDKCSQEQNNLLDGMRHIFMEQGMNTDSFSWHGESLLEQVCSAIQYGDYAAYYLAIAQGMDPFPVDIRAYLDSVIYSS